MSSSRQKRGRLPAGSINLTIISDSSLVAGGVANLLQPHLRVKVVSTHGGAFPGATELLALPNPPRHVVLLDAHVGFDATLKWIRHWLGFPQKSGQEKDSGPQYGGTAR
jgi:hypothetical protein